MKPVLCSIINFFDLMFISVINLYVLYISKQWYYFYVFYTVLGLICLIVFMMVVPESPKWLHMQTRTEEAVAVL
jgi:hypothetical protein